MQMVWTVYIDEDATIGQLKNRLRSKFDFDFERMVFVLATGDGQETRWDGNDDYCRFTRTRAFRTARKPVELNADLWSLASYVVKYHASLHYGVKYQAKLTLRMSAPEEFRRCRTPDPFEDGPPGIFHEPQWRAMLAELCTAWNPDEKLLFQWREWLVNSQNPRHEKDRIHNMMRTLRLMGFQGPLSKKETPGTRKRICNGKLRKPLTYQWPPWVAAASGAAC